MRKTFPCDYTARPLHLACPLPCPLPPLPFTSPAPSLSVPSLHIPLPLHVPLRFPSPPRPPLPAPPPAPAYVLPCTFPCAFPAPPLTMKVDSMRLNCSWEREGVSRCSCTCVPGRSTTRQNGMSHVTCQPRTHSRPSLGRGSTGATAGACRKKLLHICWHIPQRRRRTCRRSRGTPSGSSAGQAAVQAAQHAELHERSFCCKWRKSWTQHSACSGACSSWRGGASVATDDVATAVHCSAGGAHVPVQGLAQDV